MADADKQLQEKPIIDIDGFFWQDYLDATHTVEVPQTMFIHVEDTIQNGIEVGMSLEVPYKKEESADGEESAFWVASIVMVCGPLLRLRYFGGDDRSLEFWFNLTKETAHELGWSVKNDKKLEPPPKVLERSPDCKEKLQQFLSSAKPIPVEMLTGDGSMVDRIKHGMKIEVSDVRHPYKLWPATIKENIGGRLLLQYDTPNSLPKEFWLFCTHEHLHKYGFAAKSDLKYFLEPPSSIVDTHTYEEWKEVAENGLKELNIPDNLFDNIVDHEDHKFQVGMKLEAVDPDGRRKLCPATVIKVFDNTYFLVYVGNHVDINESTKDDLDELISHKASEKNTWLCRSGHPYIFPVGWAKKNNISLSSPKNWTPKSEEFDWDDYLKSTNSTAADESFFTPRENAEESGLEKGMRLEAVDPQNENNICAAHITNIVDDLLWLKLDCYAEDHPEHMVHMRSLQIFPVGWCESNHYPLSPPKDYMHVCKIVTDLKPTSKSNVVDIPLNEPRSSSWCPVIHFNYRCFTGPMISKGKLATLPKSVGPGPVTLVMREVLSMVISAGYRSSRILRVLQCDTKPDPGYNLEILKAKHKTNTYRANVAVVTSGDMVAEFCREVCKKIMVCPNLFGPLLVEENQCPDKCHKATKTKPSSSDSAGKRGPKPKIDKALTSSQETALDKPKPWGKRKKKRGRWVNKDKTRAEEYGDGEDIPYASRELRKHASMDKAEDGALSDEMEKSLEKSDSVKLEVPSSNVSEDSRSSSNDRKSKDSRESPSSSSGGKGQNQKHNQNRILRKSTKRDYDTSIESDASEEDDGDGRPQKKRRTRVKTLESNPLFWTVDDVFRYLRKTADCKDLAHRIRKEEIDGLAFLLLNLPSLIHHMGLKKGTAMKLCRHIEQVKVTFFLKHVNEV